MAGLFADGPASDTEISVEEVSRSPDDLGGQTRTARSVTAPVVLVAVSAAANKMSWLTTLRKTNNSTFDVDITADFVWYVRCGRDGRPGYGGQRRPSRRCPDAPGWYGRL